MTIHNTSQVLEVQVPRELHKRISHLAIELERDLDEIVSEALLLMLRYHDYGYGLVAPGPEPASRRGTV